MGGHAHTLPGDMDDLGKSPAGDYPVENEGSNGDFVYIVHSWEWAKAVGEFNASFDPDGWVIAFEGRGERVERNRGFGKIIPGIGPFSGWWRFTVGDGFTALPPPTTFVQSCRFEFFS